MSLTSRIYIWIISTIGSCVLFTQLIQWHSESPFRYLCFLALTLAASSMKVSLPAVTGTMSASFLVILFGVLEFSLPETLLVGCVATLMQCYSSSSRRRPPIIQVMFNMSSLAVAIACTNFAWHSPFLSARHADTAVMLLITCLVFFTMNTLPIATVISLTEGKSLRRVWKDCYFWSLPYYLFGAAVAGLTSAATHRYGWQAALLVVPLLYLIYKSYNLYVGRTEAEKKHAEEMAKLHLRTIEALALAIEAKDHTTHSHLQRVQVYAIEIAKDLGLDDAQIEALRAAALLHDIGKLAVPEHIISKPGRLTREEFDKMKIHPVVGAEILERVQFPYPVTPIVRAHHEKWNGSGYPDGLKGEEIPIGARILATVDCLDALASDRQYRRAVPLDEAMQKVVAESGVSFDPRVVEVLQRRYRELEQLANKEYGPVKLSTNVKVERGLEPAAGFENVRRSGQVSTTAEKRVDFLASIAAARSEVQNLFELTKDLGNSLSLNETMSLLSIRLKRMIPYDAMAIYVQKDGMLRPSYVTGENSRLFSSLEIPVGQGLSGWVAENKKPIINGNPSVEPGYLNDPEKFTTMRSALAVPLVGSANTLAVATLYHVEKDAFTRDHLRIMMAIAPKVALSVENALRYQQAESSAATDYMTGLPNARSLFFHLDAEISRCRRQNNPVAVLVCDMNGFKAINDRFGHLTGNRLLRRVATSLKECCREYDYVARMGGDEFVLVIPGLKADTLQQTIERLGKATVEAGREITNQDIVSLSIGHAFYPEDGTDAEQLLSEADRRMYAAKMEAKQAAADKRGYDFDSTALATRW